MTHHHAHTHAKCSNLNMSHCEHYIILCHKQLTYLIEVIRKVCVILSELMLCNYERVSADLSIYYYYFSFYVLKTDMLKRVKQYPFPECVTINERRISNGST